MMLFGEYLVQNRKLIENLTYGIGNKNGLVKFESYQTHH